jgi:hypothetical protein
MNGPGASCFPNCPDKWNGQISVQNRRSEFATTDLQRSPRSRFGGIGLTAQGLERGKNLAAIAAGQDDVPERREAIRRGYRISRRDRYVRPSEIRGTEEQFIRIYSSLEKRRRLRVLALAWKVRQCGFIGNGGSGLRGMLATCACRRNLVLGGSGFLRRQEIGGARRRAAA